MGRWTDLAVWRGPTVNSGDGDQVTDEPGDQLIEHRGMVVHIAEGSFEGTIAWQRNPDANVSSHFVVAEDGRIAQMVDTDIRAWTQAAGNSRWISVENAGHTPAPLTAAQVEANARLLARLHQVYGVPLQLADNPDGRGLGHHSMGCNWPAGAWGHCDCPGPAIIAQKPAIVARAIEIVGGDDVSAADVWAARFKGVRADGTKFDFSAQEFVVGANAAAWQAATGIVALTAVVQQLAAHIEAGGGSVDTATILAGVDERLAALPKPLTAEQTRAVVDEELDEQAHAGADPD